MLLAAPAAFAEPSLQPAGLRQLIETNPAEIDRLKLPGDELGAIYAGRDFKSAWSFSAVDNSTAANVFIDSFDQLVGYHGLHKKTYSIDEMRSLAESKDEKKHALLDLLVTASLLRVAHDLHGDTLNLDDDYVGWNFHRSKADIPALLAATMANNGANEFILSLTPKNPAYGKLAAALRSYRAYADKGGWPRIDPGPSLRPNTRGPRILQLRDRLIAEDYLATSQFSSDSFDDTLQQAISAYQQRNGLEPDGHAGEKTVEALNVPVATRIEQIEANMERWRHMPDDFPPQRYASVNIADATFFVAIIYGLGCATVDQLKNEKDPVATGHTAATHVYALFGVVVEEATANNADQSHATPPSIVRRIAAPYAVTADVSGLLGSKLINGMMSFFHTVREKAQT